MLILTRKPGESIYIGDQIKVTVVEIKGHQIRVGIDAPSELRIYREEIYLQILEENRQAAEASQMDAAGLDSLAIKWSGSDSGDAKKPSSGNLGSGVRVKTLGPSNKSPNMEVTVKKKRGKQE